MLGAVEPSGVEAVVVVVVVSFAEIPTTDAMNTLYLFVAVVVALLTVVAAAAAVAVVVGKEDKNSVSSQGTVGSLAVVAEYIQEVLSLVALAVGKTVSYHKTHFRLLYCQDY